MFIQALVLVFCLKESFSQVCDVRGEKYPIGQFINKCRKCNCNKDGSWKCDPQCPAESITCPAGQIITRVRKEVLSGCFCDKLTCVTDSNSVCDVRGEKYPTGQFINKCRKCNCNKDGSWKCDSQCPEEPITCPEGQTTTRVRTEVLKGCYCDKLTCVNNQNKVCDVRGEKFPAGPFIYKCRKCNCNKDGYWKCDPQCPEQSIVCPAGQIVIRNRTEVLSGCYCEKLTCVTNLNAVCNVRGEKYSVGTFYNMCRRCICNRDGSWKCDPQCPEQSVTCPAGQKITTVRTEVLSGCYCDKLTCVADSNAACDVRGEKYPTGSFINKCRKCNCNGDGSWQCDPQCPVESINCPAGEIITRIRTEISKGCFCDKLICVKDPNGVCQVGEEKYPIGPFMNKCRKCNCNKDGSWNCDPQCPVESITCSAGQIITRVNTEISSGCFCNKLACATEQKKECNVDGVIYSVGKFTSKCRNCICNNDGSWNCSSFCPEYSIRCEDNQVVKNIREEISGCFCDKPICVNIN
ncbi:SCO-spondin isoform X1 [Hydra vulgaris]|uniref:SCO-spondin isoform X1 n=1 Tax=Hydra vulgaris TaxID=6087 RepID=UPI001F5F534D|nr:SCO-spondin [Hydra vulgaris]